MSEPVLQGHLGAFKLPEILTLLSDVRKSGTLVLAGNARQSYLLFDRGALVFAGSDQEKLRLGAVLLRQKKISPEQHKEIDALVQRGGGRFGQLAIQSGALTEDQLRDFLKIQVAEVVFDAMVWTEGSFRFSSELHLPDHAVTISVDLPTLIMEGARRIEEWEHCLALLPDENAVFRVVAAPRDDKITLTAEEWKVLFRINGQRTLGELAGEEDDDALTVYRIVYGLCSNRLIEPVASRKAPSDTGKLQAVPMIGPDDATVREASASDAPTDRTLLSSNEARLSWSDVVRPLVAQLTVTNGDDAGTLVPLSDAEYLVGRHVDNNIRLRDPGVSAFHARIFRTPDGYAIEDLKSRNGTWVNGTRVFHATLRKGDQLRLGATELAFDVLLG